MGVGFVGGGFAMALSVSCLVLMESFSFFFLRSCGLGLGAESDSSSLLRGLPAVLSAVEGWSSMVGEWRGDAGSSLSSPKLSMLFTIVQFAWCSVCGVPVWCSEKGAGVFNRGCEKNFARDYPYFVVGCDQQSSHMG